MAICLNHVVVVFSMSIKLLLLIEWLILNLAYIRVSIVPDGNDFLTKIILITKNNYN